MDGKGCAVDAKPSWSIIAGPLAAFSTVDAGGRLTVPIGAPEGELLVSAVVAGREVSVRVEVVRPEHYDALLATRGLGPSGESEQPAVAVIATGTLGGNAAVGDSSVRERKRAFIAIVVAIAACLGFAGLIVLRRGRRRSTLHTEGELDRETVEADDEPTQDDGLAPNAPPSPAPDASNPSRTAVRPHGIPSGPSVRRRGKVCPICGERYPGEAMFCGKDGAQLAPLN
ncbi:uncharacterized protein CMC5_006780 [Chondromyces crocatus]|uniref:Uncharacterized protein n=2 Tax=Chondromyces crocatus TaxID=52 RepID=A0A0K1E6T0_CHOCO|nr:uncharacterized protein CMC5_006780 [Chondromyces crocatus]